MVHTPAATPKIPLHAFLTCALSRLHLGPVPGMRLAWEAMVLATPALTQRPGRTNGALPACQPRLCQHEGFHPAHPDQGTQTPGLPPPIIAFADGVRASHGVEIADPRPNMLGAASQRGSKHVQDRPAHDTGKVAGIVAD